MFVRYDTHTYNSWYACTNMNASENYITVVHRSIFLLIFNRIIQ